MVDDGRSAFEQYYTSCGKLESGVYEVFVVVGGAGAGGFHVMVMAGVEVRWQEGVAGAVGQQLVMSVEVVD
jgi:hypothetical protein